VARSQYLARQIATILRFAKETTDPKVAAALIEKAANLRAKVDSLPDRSSQAPDVEIPLAIGSPKPRSNGSDHNNPSG
jgi:hypothetical protein